MPAWTVQYRDGASLKEVRLSALEAIVTDTGDLVLGKTVPFTYQVAAFAKGVWKWALPVTEEQAREA